MYMYMYMYIKLKYELYCYISHFRHLCAKQFPKINCTSCLPAKDCVLSRLRLECVALIACSLISPSTQHLIYPPAYDTLIIPDLELPKKLA